MKDLAQLYYKKYKTYFVPLTIVIISIILFFQVFLGQLNEIFDKRSQIENLDTDIERLNKSLSIVRSTNETQLDSDLNIALSALPSSKDLLSIALAIEKSASIANVQVKDFSIKLGTIYTSKPEKIPITSDTKLAASIGIAGDSQTAFSQFATTLQNALPLAELKTLNIARNTASYEVSFYYKPYQKQSTPQIRIESLDPNEQKLLEKIKSQSGQ